MAGAASDLSITIRAIDQASGPIKAIGSVIGGLATGPLHAIGAVTDGLGKLGLAGLGIQALAGTARGLGDALGVGLVNEMEQVSASINAFTKDGDATKRILSEIRTEANATPFGFRELATATSALLPVAKQAKIPYMDLVKQAEILAASNPFEGLEGASFSLREAMTGDFTSIIERFNLSRSTINKLKAEGVPALEIVRRAMAEMGFDADLVAAKAQTLSGRWSTFLDTIDTVKLTIAQPIFDALKDGLMFLQQIFDDNKESIDAWAQSVATNIQRAITIFKALFAAFTVDAGAMGIVIQQLREMFGDDFANAIEPFVRAFMDSIPRIKEVATGLLEVLSNLFGFFAKGDVGSIIRMADGLTKLFGPEMAAQILLATDTIKQFVSGAMESLRIIVDFLSRGDFEGAFLSIVATIESITPDIIAKLQEWGQAFLDWIGPMIPPMLAALADLAAQVLAWVQAQAPIWAAQLVSWTEAFVEWVTPTIPPTMANLAQLAGEINNWINTQEVAFAQSLLAWARAFSEWVDPAIQQLPAQLANLAADIATWIVNSAITFAADLAVMAIQFYAWVSKEVLPNLPSALGQIMAAISAWISGAGPQAGAEAQSIGINLIEGLKAGIMARIDSIAAVGAAAVTRVLNAARAAADSHSPSMEMAKIGADLAAGLGLGIEKDTFKAVDSTKKLLDTIMRLARDQMSFAGRGAELFARALDRLADSGRLTTENMQRLRKATDDYNIVAGTAAKQAEAVAKAQKAIDIKRLFARPEELEFERRRLDIEQARLDVEKAMAPLLIQRRQAEERLAQAQKALDAARDTKSERDDKAAQAAVDAAQDQVDAVNAQIKPYEDTLQAIKDREDALRLEEEQFRITQRQAELGLEAELEFQKRLKAVFDAQQEEAARAIDEVENLNDAIQRLPDSKTIRINVETSGDIPSFAEGGIMPHTGLAYLHAGERVVPNGGSHYGGRSGDGNVIVNLTVQGSVISEQDLARSVRDQLVSMQRRGSPITI